MSAKALILRPITAHEGQEVISRYHYSGHSVSNSQLHLGVYYSGALEGCLQFGPSLDKRKVLPLVRNTPWNGCLELNRMAFSDRLPRNSESRALAISMRLIRKHAPWVQWVISYADATQSGDGTIYRAAGFTLTGIKPNNQIWSAPLQGRVSRASLEGCAPSMRRRLLSRVTVTKGAAIRDTGAASMAPFIEAGYRPLPGFQLRYIFFLDPTARLRLAVPELPYGEIGRVGAGMYRGISRAASIVADASAIHAEEGGSVPTAALHLATRIV